MVTETSVHTCRLMIRNLDTVMITYARIWQADFSHCRWMPHLDYNQIKHQCCCKHSLTSTGTTKHRLAHPCLFYTHICFSSISRLIEQEKWFTTITLLVFPLCCCAAGYCSNEWGWLYGMDDQIQSNPPNSCQDSWKRSSSKICWCKCELLTFTIHPTELFQ